MKSLRKGDLVKIASEKELRKAGYDDDVINFLAHNYAIVKEVVDNCAECPDINTCDDKEDAWVSMEVFVEDSDRRVEYNLAKGLLKKIPELRVGDRVLLKSTKKVLKINRYNQSEVLISMENDLNALEVPSVATVKEVHIKGESNLDAFGVIFEESIYMYDLYSIKSVLPKIGDIIAVENDGGEEVLAIVSDIDEEELFVYCYGELYEGCVQEFEVLMEDIIELVRKEDLNDSSR